MGTRPEPRAGSRVFCRGTTPNAAFGRIPFSDVEARKISTRMNGNRPSIGSVNWRSDSKRFREAKMRKVEE